MSELEIFAKTVYAEARGECEEGQLWVAWVIKNRAAKNRDYWGGNTIRGVCLHSNQFECWNGCSDIQIHEPQIYKRIYGMCERVARAPLSQDPTGGCDHYNNPDDEGYPPWTNNVVKVRKIEKHQFYRGD